MNLKRVRKLNNITYSQGGVVYWMSRDQRVHDNWALIFAQKLALQYNVPLYVIFCLQNSFLGASKRHFSFMLNGLKEIQGHLLTLNIPFIILKGKPEDVIATFIKNQHIGALVSDFSPLRIAQHWKDDVRQKIDISFMEVDAHNIVPTWIASSKQEFAAYTFRPKINRLLPEFLEPFPDLTFHQPNSKELLKKYSQPIDLTALINSIPKDPNVDLIDWILPGQKAGLDQLDYFIQHILPTYHEKRNDPTLEGQSNLSPYLHYGHISAQRVALEVQSIVTSDQAKEAFLEELIVRRELSDNFCFYNPNYDNSKGFPDWAKKTILEHKDDPRAFLYSQEELEYAKTYDELWNATQIEMVQRGKLHGYMRMYWAKKILEWTPSVDEAMRIAIYLNDKYELDGRDPNGYVGIAWSMGGVHDRAWFDRPIFGKIRYMNANGMKRKFDVKEYIKKWTR